MRTFDVEVKEEVVLLADSAQVLEEVGERHVVLQRDIQRQVEELTAGRLQAVPVDLGRQTFPAARNKSARPFFTTVTLLL